MPGARIAARSARIAARAQGSLRRALDNRAAEREQADAAHSSATLYADNLTNQIGVNSYTDPSQWGKYYQALVSRPRTIGLTLAYSFKEH